MSKKILKLIQISMSLMVAILACNTPFGPQATGPDPDALYTQAAQTLSVQFTSVALGASQTAVLQEPSQTPIPLTPTATETPLPTPTATLVPPTNTPIPPTPTPIPCLAIEFLRDVTIPDNTTLAAGETFEKTWRLRNAGSCTWTKDFSIVFHKGDRMDAAKSIKLPQVIEPGERLDITVDMIAPSLPGKYQGFWMLADDSGDKFGLGNNADKPFWVLIRVKDVTSGVVYSFVNNFCAADWASGDGDLPCPGNGTEPSGFVLRLDRPDLENRKENEPALWTNPEMVTDGWITGTFPVIKIKSGDRFIADIGCLADSDLCDVLFQLNYKVDGGTVKSLGEWNEVYDNLVTRLNVDLSSLDGKMVEFILTVRANGSYKEDAAFWLQPHIRR